eukprot:COSAG01_NODE_21415_length_903_cov_1.261194_1_plen_80_part_10
MRVVDPSAWLLMIPERLPHSGNCGTLTPLKLNMLPSPAKLCVIRVVRFAADSVSKERLNWLPLTTDNAPSSVVLEMLILL